MRITHGVGVSKCRLRLETDSMFNWCLTLKRGRSVVIGRTVGLVSRVGRTCDLQAGIRSWHVPLMSRRLGIDPASSATFFCGDWSWNIFYSHSLFSLIQEGLLSVSEDYACPVKHFKTLLFKNHWINFNITWQKGPFGDPLPRLIKQWRFFKKCDGHLGARLILPIYMYL